MLFKATLVFLLLTLNIFVSLIFGLAVVAAVSLLLEIKFWPEMKTKIV